MLPKTPIYKERDRRAMVSGGSHTTPVSGGGPADLASRTRRPARRAEPCSADDGRGTSQGDRLPGTALWGLASRRIADDRSASGPGGSQL